MIRVLKFMGLINHNEIDLTNVLIYLCIAGTIAIKQINVYTILMVAIVISATIYKAFLSDKRGRKFVDDEARIKEIERRLAQCETAITIGNRSVF